MNKKIITIILIFLFILVLILLNLFLRNQNKTVVEEEISEEIRQESNAIEENEIEVLKVTSENFNTEVLESDKTVLIDFYADWCSPCKILSPIVEEVAQENKNIKVVKVDIDESQDLAIKYEIMSIPTLVVIRNGQESNRIIGLVNKLQILNLIR